MSRLDVSPQKSVHAGHLPAFHKSNSTSQNLYTSSVIRQHSSKLKEMCTEEYGRYNQAQKAEGLDLINLLALKPGEKVLDLGCGIGDLTKILAQRVAPGQVVAIDPDEKRIEIANKEQAADNIKYLIGGSDNMPGENYDIIYSNYVIHWIPNNKNIFGPLLDF